jgi:hypothetical protein
MNEAAFPNPHLRDGSGMTIRDVYAGLAMQGVIAATDALIKINEPHLAMWSYKMADAMMKAREA